MTTKRPSAKPSAPELQALSEEMQRISGNLRSDAFLSIIQTADAVNRYLDSRLRQTAASRTGLAILDALVVNNGIMKPVDIAQAVSRTKYTISRVISTLEKHKLIKKDTSLDFDGRVRKIAITRKGLELLSRTLEGRQRIAEQATSVLSQKRLSELIDLLSELKKHLDSEIEKNTRNAAIRRKMDNKRIHLIEVG
jgi:DNA-binding MarR family transcriptional regulator